MMGGGATISPSDIGAMGNLTPANPVPPQGPVTSWRSWFGTNGSMQRQQPTPLAGDERRTIPMRGVMPHGSPVYGQLRRYDWGSAGFRFDSGRVTYNPIGAGVVYTKGVNVTPSATATIVNHTSIFWNFQMINFGQQPNVGPLYTPAQLNALLGNVTSQAVVPSQ